MRIVAPIYLLLMLAACGDDASGDGGQAGVDGGDSAAPSFDPVWAMFEARGCGSAFCHGAGQGELLMFDASGTYEALVDVQAAGVDCAPGGKTRVAPGDAEASLLVEKMRPDPSCGDVMPADGNDDADIQLVVDWIESGAAR
ncbi:MAG: hypothetical protein OXT09_11970 [Myxococcales bacterium]|nr:hypothetical protein [Myxococcales bacterium]